MEYTVEQLLTAIRGAGSLDELRRMVGPSEEDSKKSAERLAQLDRYFEQFGAFDDGIWPERAKALWDEQERYESVYF